MISTRIIKENSNIMSKYYKWFHFIQESDNNSNMFITELDMLAKPIRQEKML